MSNSMNAMRVVRGISQSLCIVLLLLACGALSAQNQEHRVRNIVLVHGAWADGSGWKGVYDILVKDHYNVSIVQEPETSFKEDVAATKRTLALQDGPCILVAHSYGGPSGLAHIHSPVAERLCTPRSSRLAGILANLSTSRGLRQNCSAQHRGQPSVDPALDVVHDHFLVGVVEKVMKTSFVELQCFVGGTGHVVKVLAATGPRVLVEGAVKNQDRKGDQRKISLEAFVGTDHSGHSL
jgi:hypothetical protein